MTAMIRFAAALAASVVLAGCATFNMTKPAPTQPQPVAVEFTAGELSGWSDLPIGTYRVPDSQVIISGHQKGGASGMLFGVVGVAIQHAANQSGGKKAIADAEQILRITLTEDARATTRTLLANPAYAGKFREKDAAEGPVLSVATAVVLNFVNDTDVQPFVVLKASLRDPRKPKDKGWNTRYFASTTAPRPLAGDNSWLADDGVALRAAIHTDLARALEFMMRDIQAPHPRDDAALQLVQAQFPYVKPRLQTIGYKLAEDDQAVYFVPKLGDIITFAGVNILARSAIVTRPAEKGDAPFKVVEDPNAKKKEKKKKKA